MDRCVSSKVILKSNQESFIVQKDKSLIVLSRTVAVRPLVLGESNVASVYVAWILFGCTGGSTKQPTHKLHAVAPR